MTVANKIFGHVTYTHSLGRVIPIVDDRVLTKENFNLGDTVEFKEAKTGKLLRGKITNLKYMRATIDLPKNGIYTVNYILLRKVQEPKSIWKYGYKWLTKLF